MKIGTKDWRQGVLAKMRARHPGVKGIENAELGGTTALFDVGSKGLEEDDPYKFEARITTPALDRDDEVLLPEGASVKEFDKSGAGFFNHDYDKVPIFVPGKLSNVKGAIFGQGKFLSNQLAEDVREFVKAMADVGKSAGVSVGFIPTEARNPTKKDKERFGETVRRVYTSWKLLEWSIAPVQSNPEAFVTDIGKCRS